MYFNTGFSLVVGEYATQTPSRADRYCFHLVFIQVTSQLNVLRHKINKSLLAGLLKQLSDGWYVLFATLAYRLWAYDFDYLF